MEAALSRVRGIVRARRIRWSSAASASRGPGTIPSLNPAQPSEIVGDVVAATPQDVARCPRVGDRRVCDLVATRRLRARRPAVPGRRRAARAQGLVQRAADLEVGKTWVEADADTAEAIDFLEYYAPGGAAAGRSRPPLVPSPYNEDNRLRYLPLGVGRGHPALELRPRDHGRHDVGGARSPGTRSCSSPRRTRRSWRRISSTCCTSSACRPGCVNFVPGDAPDGRRDPGRRPAHAFHLVHRIEGGRAADQRGRGADGRPASAGSSA